MPTNGSSGSGCFNKKILCISDFGFPGSHEEKICRIPVSSFMISFQRNAGMKKNLILKGSGFHSRPVPKTIGFKCFPAVDLVTPWSIRSQWNRPSRNFRILSDGSRRTDFS